MHPEISLYSSVLTDCPNVITAIKQIMFMNTFSRHSYVENESEHKIGCFFLQPENYSKQ